MYCQNCGQQIDDNAYVCIHCGVRTDCNIKNRSSDEPVHCVHCGAEIDPNAYICVHCGAKTGLYCEKKNENLPIFCAVISILMSIIGLTFLGALLAILSMTILIDRGDIKKGKANTAAIVFCVAIVICVVRSIISIIISIV